MKKLLLLFLLLSITLSPHPIKMCLLFIGYRPDSHSAYIECRMFGDDLSLAVEQEMSKKVNVGYWTREEEVVVNQFVKKHVQVSFGDRLLDLNFYEQEYEQDNKVVTLRYEVPSLFLKSGEQVAITNSMFFKQFTQAQTNVIQLEIPRVAETTIQCYMNDYTKIFTVK